MSISTLYLCYFGLREPLVQTQVLPYLRHLASRGVEVNLLTFEPRLRESWGRGELDARRAELAAQGIRWDALPYHKRPSAAATAYDIVAGALAAARIARRRRVDVLHARAHVPMAMALLARPLTGCRLIFDIRGLVAEEYADAGIWTEDSFGFRAMKLVERYGIGKADQLVVLTRKVRDWLIGQGLATADRVEVIPCCVDPARFEAAGAEEPPASFEVVYAGAATGLYLLKEMAEFFKALKGLRPDASLRIMTHSPADYVADTLRSVGLRPEDFRVGAVAPAEVPAHLRRARLGLSFRKPTFSQIAASPTKIPEYLAAGLPAVSNGGIGDVDDLLERERVGVVVKSFDAAAYEAAASRALALAGEPGVSERCAQVARRHFDLESVGGAGYWKVYSRLRRLEGGSVAQTSV